MRNESGTTETSWDGEVGMRRGGKKRRGTEKSVWWRAYYDRILFWSSLYIRRLRRKLTDER